MDWAQQLASVLSAVVGGALVIAADRVRWNAEYKSKRSETILTLYSDFFVAFQVALHHNDLFWSGVRWVAEGKGPYTEPPAARAARESAEAAFRDAAWRLRLRVKAEDQQRLIESLAKAFDVDFEEPGDEDGYAFDFPAKATAFRDMARVVLDRMQRVHHRVLNAS